jgi:hypothetical protein
VNAEDVGERIFTTDIRFLPTQQEVQQFQIVMQEAMTSTPELVLFISPFELMRVAKEDVKLAELIFRQGQKKMLLHQQQMQEQNQQATFEAQVKSAQAAEQAKGQNMQMELQMKGDQLDRQSRADKEKIVLQMVADLAKVMATPVAVGKEQKIQEGTISEELFELMKLSIKNIAIPLAVDTQSMLSEMSEQPIENEEQIKAA